MGGFPGYPSRTAYTFQPGQDFPTGSIVYWNTGDTITLQIMGNPANPSAIPIREVYFPVLYNAVSFYLGKMTVEGSPDYVTQNSGCETVDFDPVFYLTLSIPVSAAASPFYIFLRNLPTGSFRQGPVGAQVTSVTASYPLNSTGGNTPNISLDSPLDINDGGTGTNNPQLIAGTGIAITGTPFNWTIATSGAVIGKVEPDPAQSPAALYVNNEMGPTVEIGLVTPVPLGYGGTNQSSPGTTNGTNLEGNPAGSGIAVTGTIFDPSTWTFTNTGVLGCIPGDNPGTTFNGNVLFESTNGDLNIVKDDSNNALNFSLASPIGYTIAVFAKLSTTEINGAGATVELPTLSGGNTWYVECIVHGFGLQNPGSGCDDSTNYINLTGANWGMTVTDSCTQCQGTRTLYVCGVVSSGNNPSVTLTGQNVTLNGANGGGIGTAYISCGFKAIRIT